LIKVPEKKPINELIEDFITLLKSNLLCNSPTIVPTKVPKTIPIKPRKINPKIEPTNAPFTPLFDPPYFFTIYDGNKLSIKLIKILKRNVIVKKVKLKSTILKDLRINHLSEVNHHILYDFIKNFFIDNKRELPIFKRDLND